MLLTSYSFNTKEQTETDRLTGKDLLMKTVILTNHCISWLALAIIIHKKEHLPPVAPFVWEKHITNGFKILVIINPLTPNNPYRGSTAPLTSKVAFSVFIQQI